ncbi:hypothetical protein KSS87_021884, partial [Heliosperma pusillum]
MFIISLFFFLLHVRGRFVSYPVRFQPKKTSINPFLTSIRFFPENSLLHTGTLKCPRLHLNICV